MELHRSEIFTQPVLRGRTSLEEQVRKIAIDLLTLAKPNSVTESLTDGSDLIGYAVASESLETSARPLDGLLAPFDPNPLRTAKRLVAERTARAKHFPSNYFGEAAWDMLLDLYVAHHHRKNVSVSSLCIASRVPPTTALRALRALCQEGTIIRILAPCDKRIKYLELAPAAKQNLTTYLVKIEKC